MVDRKIVALPTAETVAARPQLDRLSVSRVSSADLFIRRIGNVSAGIARIHLYNALQLVEDGLRTPKAPGRQRSHL